jgi:transposase
MELEKKIADFLTRTEARPARSKLAPYDELIRTLRQRRWTFETIAEALDTEFGLKINPKTIWAYLQVRREVTSPTGQKKTDQDTKAQLSAPKRRFNLDA